MLTLTVERDSAHRCPARGIVQCVCTSMVSQKHSPVLTVRFTARLLLTCRDGVGNHLVMEVQPRCITDFLPSGESTVNALLTVMVAWVCWTPLPRVGGISIACILITPVAGGIGDFLHV